MKTVRLVGRTLSLAAASAALIAGPPLAAQDAPPPAQRRAIVIGISDYEDPAVGDLAHAADDARAFASFLRSPAAGLGGYRPEQVRVLIDEEATAGAIREALAEFSRGSAPLRAIIIFIAGRGAPGAGPGNESYLLPHDARLANLPEAALRMSELNAALRDTPASARIVFADVPHMRWERLNGFVALTAAEMNQTSREGEEWGGHGVFTFHLLQALAGDADRDGDRVVTLGEVLEYTRDRVRRATGNAQIPTISLSTYDHFWPLAVVMR